MADKPYASPATKKAHNKRAVPVPVPFLCIHACANMRWSGSIDQRDTTFMLKLVLLV